MAWDCKDFSDRLRNGVDRLSQVELEVEAREIMRRQEVEACITNLKKQIQDCHGDCDTNSIAIMEARLATLLATVIRLEKVLTVPFPCQ